MAQPPNPDFPNRDPSPGSTALAWAAIPLVIAVAVLAVLAFAMTGSDEHAASTSPDAGKSTSAQTQSSEAPASTGASSGEAGSSDAQKAPSTESASPPSSAPAPSSDQSVPSTDGASQTPPAPEKQP